jgi:hypothetical protein
VAPAQGQLAYTQPNRRACGACHDDVDWTKPYAANGMMMDPQPDSSSCIECHASSAANQPVAELKPLSVADAHRHPLVDPAIDAGVNSVITAVTGGSGPAGKFQVGDTPTLTLTIRTDAGADLGLGRWTRAALLLRADDNQQLVMPYPSPNGMSLNPFDFGGRLQSSSASNKGIMTKIAAGTAAVAEPIFRAVQRADGVRRDPRRPGNRSEQRLVGQRHASRGSQHEPLGLLGQRPRAESGARRGHLPDRVQLGDALRHHGRGRRLGRPARGDQRVDAVRFGGPRLQHQRRL